MNSFKAIAIIGVILIHTGSTFLKVPIFWDQIWRFSVPLFVALSGFGLGKKYFEKRVNLKEFFIRRVTKILPWYIAASVFFYIYNQGNAPFWEVLVWGKADYHLYFVPIIFQLYLLFPILLWLTRKFSVAFLLLILIWQLWWYQYLTVKTEVWNVNLLAWGDQPQYFFVGSWIWYFALGIYLSMQKLDKKIYLAGAIILTIFGLYWTEINASHLVWLGNVDPLIITRFTRIPVLIYASGFILIATIFAKIKLPILEQMGKVSYLVYLFHTIVLRFLVDMKLTPIILSISAVVLSFTLAWGIQKIINVIMCHAEFISASLNLFEKSGIRQRSRSSSG